MKRGLFEIIEDGLSDFIFRKRAGYTEKDFEKDRLAVECYRRFLNTHKFYKSKKMMPSNRFWRMVGKTEVPEPSTPDLHPVYIMEIYDLEGNLKRSDYTTALDLRKHFKHYEYKEEKLRAWAQSAVMNMKKNSRNPKEVLDLDEIFSWVFDPYIYCMWYWGKA